MNRFLLACLLFVTITCQGQNYNPLQYGVKRYFTNSNGYLRGIRVDSVTTSGTDTVFHLFRTVRSAGYFYMSGIPVRIDTAGGSWAGGNVIKQPDGTFLFDNLWGDTVVLKTQANLGDSWTFFNDTTQISYTATVTALDTMTVLGNLDSIKVITIAADTAGMPYTQDPVNGFQLKLSKDNGFVQAFDVYTFPYHLPDSTSDIIWLDYYLDLVTGRGNSYGIDIFYPGPYHCSYDQRPDTINSVFKLVDFHNPVTLEFANFAMYDVYKYQDGYSSGSGATYYDHEDTVILTSVTPVTRSYSVSDHFSIHNFPADTYSAGTPTVINGYEDSTRLIDTTLMPEERGSQFYYNYFPAESPDSGLCNIGGKYVVNSEHMNSYGIVWYGSYPDIGQRFNTYAVTYYLGFGEWAIDGYDASSNLTHTRYMTYLSMAGSICYGSFRWLAGMKDVSSDLSLVSIYPNPTDGRITIKLPKQQCTIRISNVMGQQVYTAQADNQEFIVDMSSLSAGLYTVAIADNSGNSVVRKLSVVH
jgi:hypothetical protein